MISLASLLDTALGFVAVTQQMRPRGFIPWTWLILKDVLSQVVKPVLVLKVVLRFDLGWDKIVPNLKRLPSSSLERRSERVDAETPWILRGGVSLSP